MKKSLLALLSIFFAFTSTYAAVRTWDGGGADANWLTAANWEGDVAPAANDDLVFPATAAQLSNNNNFFLLTAFRSITIDGAYSIGGQPMRLTSALNVNSGTVAINTAITMSGGQTVTSGQGATATLAILSVSGSGVTINGLGAVGVGLISGSGSIVKNDTGAALLLSANSFSGTITVNNGLFVVDGAIPSSAVTINSPTVTTGTLALSGFGGTGTVGVVNVVQGALSAGTLTSPTGILSTGNLTFTSNGNFVAKLGGTTPGANGHDQLNVTGTVALGNARLAPIPWGTFRPAVGDSFLILKNDGTDAISGTFLDLPEGAIFGGPLNTAFRVSYVGGDGNDVVITRVGRAPFDFDGDGKTDAGIFRPSAGSWNLGLSATSTNVSTQWGTAGDVIAPADFDGDNRTDICIYRNGVWWILNSFSSTVSTVGFGLAGDIPIPGDFDGDGRADIAVWRPSDGVWYQLRSLGNQFGAIAFGQNGDKPMLGDFDGDGLADPAVYRPQDGVWHLLMSANSAYVAFPFGIATDRPCAADYDGDGKTDPCVFRATADGTQPDFYILRTSDNTAVYASWGLPGDIPLIADFDGDGRSDVGVSRPSTRNWYFVRSGNGSVGSAIVGVAGDIDVPAAFVP